MDLTIIIPTLNEEKNIGKLVSCISKDYPELQIIVCDDGSTDKTQEIVRNTGVSLIDRTNEKVHGLTASVLDGINNSKTKFSIVMDGDLQHPPTIIEKIYSKLIDGNDIVVGVRKKVMGRWPLNRKLVSHTATLLAKIRLFMAGNYVKDPMSGFFGCRTNLVKKIIPKARFELEGYKILFDILKYCPMKTDYVDYVFGTRKGGSSKLGNKQILCFLRSLVR